MRYAEQLGRVLAEAASLEPLVEEVWVSTHPGGVRLWLITQDVDDHQEYELHGLADILYEEQFKPGQNGSAVLLSPSASLSGLAARPAS
jgi:hypothetical protein